MIGLVLDHLWQSTLFAGAASIFILMLRDNSAGARFWLWFAASAKFLLPFAALTALSSVLIAPRLPPLPTPALSIIQPAAVPFAASAPLVTVTTASDLTPVLLILIWGLGIVAVVAYRMVHLLRLQRLYRTATDLPIHAPVKVKRVPSPLEPGLVGIWRPTILLPEGIETCLSPDELSAILAHEFCHYRRHDNLLAAIHMLVETLFWFHPLVWWLGSRLEDERERACDEMVLAEHGSPHIYAESILKVCKFYVQSPLASVPGVSGADLKKRVRAIMENRLIRNLSGTKKAVLASMAAIAVGVPIAAAMVPRSIPCTSNCTTASSGTADALRHFIGAWEKHQPDFSALTPGLAQNFMQQQAQVQQMIDDWGTLESIVFQGAGPGGGDLYLVTFAHELTIWQIGPLAANGKIPAIRFSVAFIRGDRTKPSPGTEAALRRQLEGWARHQPDVAALSPALAAVSLAQPNLHKLFNDWGPYKSIKFARVDANGWDEYEVTFEHGLAIYSIAPLDRDGKITALALHPAFRHPGVGPSPGVESFLLGEIMSLENGSLDYREMTPTLAAVISHEMPELLAYIRQWGDLKTVRFGGVASDGMEIYHLTFTHGQAEWRVAPLTADGKAQWQILSLYQGKYLQDRQALSGMHASHND